MKKSFALCLAVLLLTTLPISSSGAAVKGGSKCSKAGATSTSAGKKYTCIKSGKKLIWNKGVKIKQSSSVVAGVCPPASAADKTEISALRANALITMGEDFAEQCAASLDWDYRVGERDGELFAGTKDYNPSRVTVAIKAGVITGVLVG
jgi:hypothetical protein